MKRAAIRSLLVLYSAAIIYGLDAITGTALLRESPGIQTLFSLLRDAIQGNIRNSDDKIDWVFIALLMKLLYVLCFSNKILNRMLVDENVKVLGQAMEKIIEEKRKDLMFLSFRLISFFIKIPAV